jgi:integrase
MTRGTYRSRPEPGSVAALVAAFRMSPRYRDFSPTYRKAIDTTLSRFNLVNHRHQVHTMTRGLVIALRDEMADVPGAANNWLSHIRTLLDYAVDLEYIAHNPARDVKPLRPKRPGGHRTWREDEIDAYLAHWGPGTEARLTLLLALYTGAAAVDLVKLGWHSIGDGDARPSDGRPSAHFGGQSGPQHLARIRYRRQKTERSKGTEETPLVDVPILPPLAEELEHGRSDRDAGLDADGRSGSGGDRGNRGVVDALTFLNRSPDALAHAMRLWTAKAGLGAPDRHGRHLTLHGLRKAMGRRLAEAGASVHMIQAILGHESLSSVQIYTRAYDRKSASDTAMELLQSRPLSTTVVRLKKDNGK